MAAQSAGILLYKRQGRGLLVLLAHPGGPFWRNKDDGAWSIHRPCISCGRTSMERSRLGDGNTLRVLEAAGTKDE